MAVLSDGQFEIDGVPFGGVWDSIKVVKVEPPEASWGTNDTDNAFRPSTFMGADLLRPGDWQFEMRTDAYTMDDAKTAADHLAASWLRGGRRQPGSLSVLRYRMGNRTRLAYGRGREFHHKFDQWSYSGTSPIVASFQMASPFFYDDGERSVKLGYTPPVTGGLVAPLSSPLTSFGTGATFQGGVIDNVGGSAPTPIVVHIYGPTQNVIIRGSGWSIDYSAPIAADEIVTIDTQFGVTMAYNNFGRVVNGNLSWRTNLTKALLSPGAAEITYQGFDMTNTSYAVVRWRPAWHTY